MAINLQNETFESRDLLQLAEASILRGDYQRASLFLGEALKISPDNPIYISHLGLCTGMKGNITAAEDMCRKAIKLSPLEPIMFVNLGRVFLESGRRKEAREAFMQAYEIDNTNAPAALELSRMGIRRRPALPFLNRENSLNVYLGRLRCKISELRGPKIKKL
ncbi:MAG: hypothetical protein KAX38_07930 [Candidatus Krumholzibacteria bacterium]|nr:hypothetical protein [Candidatus Krumholzibacteria bacterium]